MEIALIIGGIVAVSLGGLVIWSLQRGKTYEDVSDEGEHAVAKRPLSASQSHQAPATQDKWSIFAEGFLKGEFYLYSEEQLLVELRRPNVYEAMSDNGYESDELVHLLTEELPPSSVRFIVDGALPESLVEIRSSLRPGATRQYVDDALIDADLVSDADSRMLLPDCPPEFFVGDYDALSPAQIREVLSHEYAIEAFNGRTDTTALLPYLSEDLDILVVEAILKGVDEADRIADVMLNTTSDNVSHEAISRLESFEDSIAQSAFSKVALAAPTDSPTDAGFRAVHELHAPLLLAKVAEHAKNMTVRLDAIVMVDDRQVLQRIAANDTDDEVRDTAAQRLAELDP